MVMIMILLLMCCCMRYSFFAQMNLSNLLSSSEGNQVQPVQGTLSGSNFAIRPQGPALTMNQHQFPNLPRVPGLMQQQLLGNLPSNFQMAPGASSSGMTISGVDRQRKADGPVPKKPKL